MKKGKINEDKKKDENGWFNEQMMKKINEKKLMTLIFKTIRNQMNKNEIKWDRTKI